MIPVKLAKCRLLCFGNCQYLCTVQKKPQLLKTVNLDIITSQTICHRLFMKRTKVISKRQSVLMSNKILHDKRDYTDVLQHRTCWKYWRTQMVLQPDGFASNWSSWPPWNFWKCIFGTDLILGTVRTRIRWYQKSSWLFFFLLIHTSH